MEKSGSWLKKPDCTGGEGVLQEGLEDCEKLLQRTRILRVHMCDRAEEDSCRVIKKPDQQGRSE
jgi:hypothetical protein